MKIAATTVITANTPTFAAVESRVNPERGASDATTSLRLSGVPKAVDLPPIFLRIRARAERPGYASPVTFRPLGVLLFVAACTGREPNAAPPPLGMAPQTEPTAPTAVAEPGPAGPLSWQTATGSLTLSRASGIAAVLDGLCERADGALDLASQRLARRALSASPQLDPAELSIELRAAGAPYVWSRSWSYSGPALDPEEVRARAERWLQTFHDRGKRTCG